MDASRLWATLDGQAQQHIEATFARLKLTAKERTAVLKAAAANLRYQAQRGGSGQGYKGQTGDDVISAVSDYRTRRWSQLMSLAVEVTAVAKKNGAAKPV